MTPDRQTDRNDDSISRRIIELDGCHNLRDMGGYQARDGRHIKWGVLYRSGAMTNVSPAGADELHNLGIKTICDLRANGERSRRPQEWHRGGKVDYYSRDNEMSGGDLAALVNGGAFEVGAVEQLIREVYLELPFEQAEAYRELFRRLIAGQVPLLFNCSAGKDRTGVAAALILHTLDIPFETIEYDYALTDRLLDQLLAHTLSDPRYARLAALPLGQYLPAFQADPASLAISFREIERRAGSVAAYLETTLGVGQSEIEILRGRLLE